MAPTAAQIASIAPDAASLAAGKKTADPRQWRALGRSDDAIWGECQGSAVYQVRVALVDLAAKCSCPSRKFPCKHALGLLLLAEQSFERIPATTAPDWVTEWILKRGEAAQKKPKNERARTAATAPPPDPEDTARRARKRMARVMAGIEGLERWMGDLVRTGLASAPHGDAAWATQAARLVDAQAPGLAARIRLLGSMPRVDAWAEGMADGLGRLMLLLHAARRIDTLEPGLAAEVRAAVGWTLDREEVMASGQRVRDRWAVLGQVVEENDRVTVQRTWLRALQHQRDALVLQFAAGTARFPEVLLPGTRFDAELAFWPGSFPLRALVRERTSEMLASAEAVPMDTVTTFLDKHAAALARQPWLERFPAGLADIVPVNQAGRFMLVDAQGAALPLVGPQSWKLLAIAGGRGAHVFGEWDGSALRALGVFAEGHYHVLAEAS